jgi:hypothetical protein
VLQQMERESGPTDSETDDEATEVGARSDGHLLEIVPESDHLSTTVILRASTIVVAGS